MRIQPAVNRDEVSTPTAHEIQRQLLRYDRKKESQHLDNLKKGLEVRLKAKDRNTKIHAA